MRFAIDRFYCHKWGEFFTEANHDPRFALKDSEEQYAPDQFYRAKHIRLSLNLDLRRKILEGRCETTLQSILAGQKPMIFDAVNMKITAVFMGGRKISHHYEKGRLTVVPPEALKVGQVQHVDIRYSVRDPKLGLYFVGPSKSYPKKPLQAWTQGEDEYARYWFPCFDAPGVRASTEIIVTVPSGFTAISNGRLIKTTRTKTSVTAHWLQKVPHAPYLVTLAVGKFSEIKDRWRGKPVLYYCEKGREADTQRAFGKTPKMMEFFSSKIGVPYPYDKYAQVAVADFIYGGMENTSATTQTDSALLDERSALDYTSDELVAHELAHQWFGDYLTCKDWSHAWLNESFATYFDALFKEFDRGNDEFLYALRRNAQEYFSEDKNRYRRSIVTYRYKRPSDLFDRHLYEKGSLVLHMLRHELGDNLFWRSIRRYVEKHRAAVVETNDLIHAIEKTTGRNMRRFFDQWVFGPGHPEYQIRSWWNSAKKELNLRITQINAKEGGIPVFHISTEVLFGLSKKEERKSIQLSKKSQLFKFTLPEEPSYILFDPDHAILKRVDFPKSETMLIQQLKQDKNPLGRIEAVQELGKIQGETALAALQLALDKDVFWGVRVHAALAIGGMKSEKSAEILAQALDTIDHPKVRRALYSALGEFKSQRVARLIAEKFKSEQSYFCQAEALVALGEIPHDRAPLHLKEALRQDSWNEVIRSAALDGLGATRSKSWIPLLIEHTRWGHPHKVRITAVRALVRFGAEPHVLRRFMDLTRDPFLLVQLASIRALQQVGDERALPLLKKFLTGDWDGRLKRVSEEAIEKIKKGSGD